MHAPMIAGTNQQPAKAKALGRGHLLLCHTLGEENISVCACLLNVSCFVAAERYSSLGQALITRSSHA